MTDRPIGPPALRPVTYADITSSLRAGLRDFKRAPGPGLFFANFFVVAGLVMAVLTFFTGQTYWLVLAVLGFPLIGALASLGFYEISRRTSSGNPPPLGDIIGVVWSHKSGQLPWLATIIIVTFLFWFFLGHMIFALFLGLSPMTNVSSSLDVYWTSEGMMMLAFGTVVGGLFSVLVFSISVMGMPMIYDRDVDFITAMLRSIAAVRRNPILFLGWGGFIAVCTLVSMLPAFLGLYVAMPVFGHATWHLYQRAKNGS